MVIQDLTHHWHRQLKAEALVLDADEVVDGQLRLRFGVELTFKMGRESTQLLAILLGMKKTDENGLPVFISNDDVAAQLGARMGRDPLIPGALNNAGLRLRKGLELLGVDGGVIQRQPGLGMRLAVPRAVPS